MPPRREGVRPGFYGIAIPTNSGWREARAPAIAVVKLHRDAQPSLGSFEPPQQLRGENSVPFPEDISPNFDRLIDDPLDGKAAGVDERIDGFDVDSMTGQVADGGDAHVRCHGSTIPLPPSQPARQTPRHVQYEPTKPRLAFAFN